VRDINIYKFDNNVIVYYTNKRVSLPEEYKGEVEKYWKLLLQSGKKFFRGDIFTVTSIKKCSKYIEIFVELTDYAHYLYTIHKNTYSENDCRIIYTSVLIETSDEKLVLGKMNIDTAAPQKLQFVGGGIDKDDINGNIIDLVHNVKKEVLEELGINTDDKDIIKEFRPYLLKDGGHTNFLSVIYKLDLRINEIELLNRFYRYSEELVQQGISPELSSLVLIKSDCDSINDFILNDTREKDENLIPTLKIAAGITV